MYIHTHEHTIHSPTYINVQYIPRYIHRCTHDTYIGTYLHKCTHDTYIGTYLHKCTHFTYIGTYINVPIILT
jgi:hypothetical protein